MVGLKYSLGGTFIYDLDTLVSPDHPVRTQSCTCAYKRHIRLLRICKPISYELLFRFSVNTLSSHNPQNRHSNSHLWVWSHLRLKNNLKKMLYNHHERLVVCSVLVLYIWCDESSFSWFKVWNWERKWNALKQTSVTWIQRIVCIYWHNVESTASIARPNLFQANKKLRKHVDRFVLSALNNRRLM